MAQCDAITDESRYNFKRESRQIETLQTYTEIDMTGGQGGIFQRCICASICHCRNSDQKQMMGHVVPKTILGMRSHSAVRGDTPSAIVIQSSGNAEEETETEHALNCEHAFASQPG